MNAFVTCDNNWGISYKGRPVVSIPADEKLRLREISGKVAVYGSELISNLPGQQPVRDCVNIVYTAGRLVKAKDAVLCDTLSDVERELLKYRDEDIFFLNNEALYNHFWDKLKTIHVTKIDYVYSTDEHFINLDECDDFEITHDSDEQYCHDIVYSFLCYERRHTK